MQTKYWKIRSAIEQALNSERQNFIIYPYGESGVEVKQILNDSFGIKEAYIVDNRLSMFNKKIKNLDFCKNLPRNQYTVLFTCENRDVYFEVLKEAECYFEKDNIVTIFANDPYETILPSANYAPWRKEAEFMKIYKKISEITLVDLYRCYELWHLLIESKKCAAGNILEVGVYKGGTGALLAAAAEFAEIDSEIFLCDTFKGVVKTGKRDNVYKGGEHNDTSIGLVKNLLQSLNLQNVHIEEGVFPDDMSDRFDGRTYRFVHIDVDAYASARDIFNYVWKAMEIGGIVVFDDYGFSVTRGVTVMLEEIMNSIQDGIFVENINGHGIFIKTSH